MSKIQFTKMHGLGNDYIYIDAIKNKDLKEIFTRYSLGALVRYLSDRHFGIGGDGVIFLDSSTVADFKMRIFNSDGTEAEMCGNGIRAFAKYIYDNSLAEGEILKIETLAGIKEIKREKYLTGINNEEIDEYVVNMGQPKVWGKTELEISDNKIETINISIGNPHTVIFVENVDNIQINKIGPIIENYKYFPQKTNVEFVQILDKNLIKVRVWERGSGETLACGTGSCAAVIAGVTNNLTKRKVKVLLQGGELEIDWNEQDNNVYMKGIATKVFDGTIEI
mgnify:FL=1